MSYNSELQSNNAELVQILASVNALPDASGNVVQYVPQTLKDGGYYIRAINHRGYCTEAPENTIPAYIKSKENGFNFVECDVAFTADNVPVLLHDSTIDGVSDGTGNIADLTYADVLNYDFGSWKSVEYTGTKIATFREFIVLCKNIGLHPYIELKSTAAYTIEQIEIVVDMVESVGMRGNVTYISFSEVLLGYVKDIDPTARLGYIIYGTNPIIVERTNALKTGYNEVFINLFVDNVTDNDVQTCISNGFPLEVWTVNDANVIKGLNPYISGVTSDNLIAGKVLKEAAMVYTPPTDPNEPQTQWVFTSSDIRLGGCNYTCLSDDTYYLGTTKNRASYAGDAMSFNAGTKVSATIESVSGIAYNVAIWFLSANAVEVTKVRGNIANAGIIDTGWIGNGSSYTTTIDAVQTWIVIKRNDEANIDVNDIRSVTVKIED